MFISGFVRNHKDITHFLTTYFHREQLNSHGYSLAVTQKSYQEVIISGWHTLSCWYSPTLAVSISCWEGRCSYSNKF